MDWVGGFFNTFGRPERPSGLPGVFPGVLQGNYADKLSSIKIEGKNYSSKLISACLKQVAHIV